MNKFELQELARLAKKLGEEIQHESEDGERNPPDSSERNNIRDLYLPRIPANFYYDSKVFKKLLGIR